MFLENEEETKQIWKYILFSWRFFWAPEETVVNANYGLYISDHLIQRKKIKSYFTFFASEKVEDWYLWRKKPKYCKTL